MSATPWPLHIHHHYPSAVQHEQVKGAPVTYVLWRCTCGDVYSEELDGTWTLDQVRGRS